MTNTNHIPGSYSAPIDVNKPQPVHKIAPMKMALGRAIAELGTLYMTPRACPDFPSMYPIQQDFDKVAEYLEKVALIMGRLLRSTGIEVNANALCDVELVRFADDTFLDSIKGWATDECYRAGEAAAEALEDGGQGDAGDRAWNERRV